MWSKEPDIAKVLFNTLIDVKRYQFTQGILPEESGMTKVLFDIQNNNNMKFNK